MKAYTLLEQACTKIAQALETPEVAAKDEALHDLLIAAKRLLETAMQSIPKPR